MSELAKSNLAVPSLEPPHRKVLRAWLVHPDMVERFNNDAAFHVLLEQLAKAAEAVLVRGEDAKFWGPIGTLPPSGMDARPVDARE